MFVGVLSKCFSTALQLVAPFIIMELLIYVFIGIAQKLMPQIQLFLIVMPAQIWGGMNGYGGLHRGYPWTVADPF